MARYRNIAIRLSLENTEKVKETLRSLGSDGESALRRIERSVEPPSKALKALNEVMVPVRAKMEDFVGQAGTAGRVLSVFGGAGVVAAAGVGILSAAFWRGTEALLENEKIHKRLEATFSAMGHAAGLTAGQIDDFADKVSESTGIQDDAISKAAASLATFRSVSGDVFTETIKSAADLSAVFGGSLEGNVQSLGLAMEMLADGKADGLRKAFKALTVAEEAHIKSLAESGQAVEAQRALLNALERAVGGSADAFAESASKISNSWDELLKKFGSQNIKKVVSDFVLDGLVSINGIYDLMTNPSSKLYDLKKEREELLKFGADLEQKGRGDFNISSRQEKLAEYDKEIAAIEKSVSAERSKQKFAQESAAQTKREIELQRELQKEEKQNKEAREKETAAEEAAIEARKRAHQGIAEQIKSLSDEREGLVLNKRERLIHAEMIKAENAVRVAGTQLTDKETASIKENTAALFEQRAANEAAEEAMAKVKDKEKKVLRDFEHSVDHTTDNITDAFVSAWDGSKTAMESFRDFFLDTMNEIVANSIIRPVIQPIVEGAMGAVSGGGMSGFWGSIGTIASSIFHDGGVVGGTSTTRAVPAHIFSNAPRYHAGGFAGFAPEEVPAILKRGERVLPIGSSVGGSTKQEFNFNVEVSGGQAATNPSAAASAGRALALSMKTEIIKIIQDEKRFGGSLYGTA